MVVYYLKRPFHFIKTGLLQGVPAQIKTRFPQNKLTVTVVTGTDGKTTTSTLLYHILKKSGLKTGLISTVGAHIGNSEVSTGFHVTSPQPNDLYGFMRELVDQGSTHLVLEATSHGMYQYRTWGITPNYAGLTNISHEHLDYHHTYREYLKAKMILLKKADVLVLNESDGSYTAIRKLYPALEHQVYGSEPSLTPDIEKAIAKRFKEPYNRLNARLAATLALLQGVKAPAIAGAIGTFAGVPGRMETVATEPCTVIIDFAHTPNGLSSALSALRSRLPKNGRLIAVYGSAGERDAAKRPLMGRAGSELADCVVLTAEDPRTEDVWSIIRQMKEGISENHGKVISIADRHEAIKHAVTVLAKPQDIVAILGKGHEQSMCFGTEELPWSDAKAVADSIRTYHKKRQS
jgi:UDP-N-acetylmuramoyl-L-alanyl-D-glutamate--2,6-diaminopimelate ligase